MSVNAPVLSRSQRLRLRLFRVSACILLTLSIMGCGALCIGLYFTITEPSDNWWFGALLLVVMAVVLGLLIRVCVRALRVRSVDDLERQSESRWLYFAKSPPSPNNSLERQ